MLGEEIGVGLGYGIPNLPELGDLSLGGLPQLEDRPDGGLDLAWVDQATLVGEGSRTARMGRASSS